MGYAGGAAYLLLLPTRLSFPWGTRLRISDHRTGFRIADEKPRRGGTAQRSYLF